jgi:outer membrane receptor protein involved in Fe transport
VSTAIAGHKLMLGFEAQDNTRQDQAVNDLAAPSNDILIALAGYRIGVYGQDEWRIAESLTATMGLRLDRSNVSKVVASPRAGLIWRATSDTTLKTLYGRAHRAANSFERDYTDGLSQVANPALGGETIDTLEMVADQRIGRDLAVRASIYQWTMRDLVTLGVDPASGLAQYQSGATVKARGLELSADKTWQTGARMRGSVSVQDSAFSGGGSLPNAPRVLAKLNLSTPLPVRGVRAGYELRYDSARTSLSGTELGGYAVSNLTLSFDALARGLELSVGVFNLFDQHYLQPAANTNWQNAFEQDGRSLRLRLSYRFDT